MQTISHNGVTVVVTKKMVTSEEKVQDVFVGELDPMEMVSVVLRALVCVLRSRQDRRVCFIKSALFCFTGDLLAVLERCLLQRRSGPLQEAHRAWCDHQWCAKLHPPCA